MKLPACYLFLTLFPVLAACVHAAPDVPPGTISDPAATRPADVTPGFNEKEPDTCKAAGLASLVGQPAGMIRTVTVAGPVRVIAPDEIVSQEEYDSTRINVETDAAGNIRRISCG